MKLRNIKYILFLLAIIMLATGCGCSASRSGKGAADGDITELEAIEKKLLCELESLYMDAHSPQLSGAYRESTTEADVKKEFEEEYTDPTNPKSYVWAWNTAKKINSQNSMIAFSLIGRLEEDLYKNKKSLNSTLSPSKRAYREKRQKFLENRLKMIHTFFGVVSESNTN